MKLRLDDTSRVQGLCFPRPGLYDYAPSVRWENGKYRMLWASGLAGDYIVESDSVSAGGPWSPARIAMGPSNKKNTFDGAHVNDPTVVKIGKEYYCYYGGLCKPMSEGGTQPEITMLGMMSSYNGLLWGRRNGGNPLIRPHDTGKPYTYGAGQPAAVTVGVYTYLFFMDSTGKDSNPINHSGTYVIRSKNALFTGPVEEFVKGKWVIRSSTSKISTETSIADAVSIDMQWSDMLGCWMMGICGVPGSFHLRLYDTSFQLLQQIEVPNVPWTEGPAFARDINGHALRHAADPSNRIPLIVFYPSGNKNDVNTWEISYFGTDLVIEK